MSYAQILADAGLAAPSGDRPVATPVDGSRIAGVSDTNPAAAIARAAEAFAPWRATPPPVRGELVRLWGEELRRLRDPLGRLVTLDCGKIVAEGIGEVQEMIDICDFAVGLSRQLHGLTIASERPEHHMREMWHPLGPAGVITSFNFPAAPMAWNTALALVCGDPVVWKPSEKTPLTALAIAGTLRRAAARHGGAPDGLVEVVIGGAEAGEALAVHPDVAIVSATGSTRMGRAVGQAAAGHFKRTILELGGNNAMIVAPSADLDMAVRAIVFAAAGTCGQRCTTLRRLIVHDSVRAELTERLIKVYAGLPIGDPLADGTLVGPLIDAPAAAAMDAALARAAGTVHGGGRLDRPGAYVRPAIVEMPAQDDLVREETFAPILYTLGYRELDEAIQLQNDVPQGLSSAIFTTDLGEAERFLSATGSDCGIANVNMGPSGAEIGGAFGGEKATGGGRESGSDAWKGYMRRQTQTINWGRALPLAQGLVFDV